MALPSSEAAQASRVAWRPWGVWLLAAMAALNAFFYYANWGGDPEIHMIFASHFAAGHPLQFNVGEFSTGETSPLYMLLVALFYSVMSPTAVMLAMKAVGVLSALGIAWLVRDEALRALADPRAAWTLALSFLAMPFVWFQAWLGMENMLMAVLMAPLVVQMLRQPARAWTTPQLTAWALGLGVATLLRPEAIFFCYALALHLLIGRRVTASLSVGAATTVVAVGFVLAIQHYTGVPLHGAGAVRAALGHRAALAVPVLGHVLYLHPKPARILVYTWPVLLVLAAMLRERRLPQGAAGPLLLCCVAAPVALQTLLITPATHSSRYLLPTYATLWLVTPTLIAQTRPLRWLPWAVLLSASLAFGTENFVRHRYHMGGMTDWSHVTRDLDPDATRRLSDFVCSVAGCHGEPVVLAAREVQCRLVLDDRFVVRSLDGIVDHQLEEYIRPWGVDYIGYIEGRNIRVLVDLLDYNLDDSHFSLRELRTLGVGQSRRVQDLVFTRQPGHPRLPTIITVSHAAP